MLKLGIINQQITDNVSWNQLTSINEGWLQTEDNLEIWKYPIFTLHSNLKITHLRFSSYFPDVLELHHTYIN